MFFQIPYLNHIFQSFPTQVKWASQDSQAYVDCELRANREVCPSSFLKRTPRIRLTIIPDFLVGFKLLKEGSVSRPPFIVEMAKQRLKVSATFIGILIERNRAK